MISVIITNFNEGEEVKHTVDSVRQNTSDCEIIIVDDASTDNSWDAGADQVVRHDKRVGIVKSRISGIKAAKGDVYAFLDAHQRVTEGCFNLCADLAVERQAIVWPCVRGLEDRHWTGHGCKMKQQNNGLFVGEWKTDKRNPPRDKISRCSMMIVPGYVIPKSVYPKVQWIDTMKEWGGSEPCICTKALMAEVDILHLCGPMARHLFRGKVEGEDGKPTKKIDRPFSCSFQVTWRNHAQVARVCFEDDTWENYWWKEIFSEWSKDRDEFDDPELLRKRDEFRVIKRRSDEEFWRGAIHGKPVLRNKN